MANMNYRLLGRSGLRVSEISLGTMTFGEEWGWGSSKDEARRIYDAYRDVGGNFIDTANVYTNGESERFLGEFIASEREEIVVATKYSNAMPGNDANAGGNHRKNMVQSVEASLRRLGTDYIDLYWMHVWDQMTPVEEVMRAFDDLVRAGKVLYVGVSNAPAWWIARANTIAEFRGWTKFVGMQIEYSLLERTVEAELIPLAKDQQMGVVAWSPLSSGQLTGKYLPENRTAEEGDRMNHEMLKAFVPDDERRRNVVREVVSLASELGVSAAQVALAWLRYRPVTVIPIVGARKLGQLSDNIASLELALSPDQIARLDRVSAPELGYPHPILNNEMSQALAFGGMRSRILA